MEGTCFASDWAAVAAGLSGLRGLLGRLHQAGSDRLGPMFAELDELKLLAEAGQVAVLGEGLSRGDVRESDAASPAGWVRHWGHSYLAGGAAALVAVTVAIAEERNRVLREAVLAARAPVRNAAVALTEMDRLRPRLTPEAHDTVLAGFVALAEDLLRLDPEGSAVLESILGPLAAPQPSTEHGSDTRTSDQRRADALVQVCRRAAAAGGAAPATAEAAVVVTMGYQDLLKRTGAGTTLARELLAPETVRRMAC